MKYKIFITRTFKKDLKRLSKDEKNQLHSVVDKLSKGEPPEEKHKDHKLIGNFHDCRECHIKPDLVLIYKINNNLRELALVRVGQHSNLFK